MAAIMTIPAASASTNSTKQTVQQEMAYREKLKSSRNVWPKFLTQCLSRRIRKELFSTLVAQLYEESPIPGRVLVDVLLDYNQKNAGALTDPLINAYLDILLTSGKVTGANLLDSLYKNSKYCERKQISDNISDKPEARKNSADIESVILELSARQILKGAMPATPTEARGILQALAVWMNAVSNLTYTMDPHTGTLYDSLGTLAIAALESHRIIGVIDTWCPKGLLDRLSQSFSAFITCWSQSATSRQAQNAERLAHAVKARVALQGKMTAENKRDAMEVEAALQIEATPDLQPSRSRASNFIFLSSLLFSRPLSEDIMILSYLQMSYRSVDLQLDIDSLAVDLVVGSFDLLSCAIVRKESDHTIFALKSFLINKVPTLLTTLSASMFSSDRIEVCIGQALAHVDLAVFPTPSNGMMANSPLQDVRQEFLFSCTLHSLLRAESVKGLLEEDPLESPPSPSSRYSKETLIEQCSSDSERIGRLIEELEKLDGNAGTVALTVTDVIRNLCTNKDTMALKSICGSLSGKPRSLDVIMQFTAPVNLLQPICQLLDTWRYEEDQGEYQPVYDEFASIFLLVLACIYRYNLSTTDLGIVRDSFVAKFLTKGQHASVLEELSEEQSKQLTTWIKGLFNPDSITDEVLSSCSPQEFYLLVPTIFSQIIFAGSSQVLTPDLMKTPLEYLLEPFLVPCLVGAVHWMINHAWRQEVGDTQFTITVVRGIVIAQSDAKSMHRTVLSIVADPLYQYLQKMNRKKPTPPTLEKLFNALKPHTEYRRTIYFPCPELQTWNSTQGSMKAALQTTFQSLIAWSTSAAINPTQGPPTYSPRQIHTALAILGAPTVLSTLLDEIKGQTSNPQGAAAVAIDIATALICSPTPGSDQAPTDWSHNNRSAGRMTLREALNLAFADAPKLLQTDSVLAESIVRLHRRVEAQLTVSPNALPALSAQIMPELDGMGGHASNIIADDGMDFTGVSGGANSSMDLTGDAGMGGLHMSGANSVTGGLDMLGTTTMGGVGEDDFYPDLDLNDMGMGDDLDLSAFDQEF